ncbi:transposase [Cyanobium sp. BA20m-14]|uniref:transposase n=1 Tax=Cyanobium sp. BA20m-14 TaxID=2823703 RepID=UPI0020CD12A5|nr:transposase [Cyanobium sp. BA20m-14]MCP9913972.1 transposase [Cyanobium sp. BA20m-14]
MEGTTAGALIPEIVRRGFQDLLEAEVSAAIGATRHERCPDERSTHRNGYRQRLLSAHNEVGRQRVTEMLRKRKQFPTAVPVMDAAR